MGSIDDKYDVAISTACGALDNIVVDSMETAIKCVEFLKRNNIGTATFIGLNKVRTPSRSSPFQDHPGGIGLCILASNFYVAVYFVSHVQMEDWRKRAFSTIST